MHAIKTNFKNIYEYGRRDVMWKGSRAVYTNFAKLVQLQTKIQCHIVLAEDTIKGNREGYILR